MSSFYSKPFVYITVVAVSVLVIAVAHADEDQARKSAPAVSAQPSQVSSSATSPMSPMPEIPATSTSGDTATSLSPMTALTPDAMQWVPAPDILPIGTKMVMLEGDLSKPGPFTMRIKLPANYMVAPHTHPGIEHVTVISGTFNLGVGEKFDATNGKALPVGSFVVMQPGFAHYAWGAEETVLQLHGMAPWGMVFLNPEALPTQKP